MVVLVLFAGDTNNLRFVSASSSSNYLLSIDTEWTGEARSTLATASAGRIAMFGGGYNGTSATNVVDVFDIEEMAWSVTNLPTSAGRLRFGAAGAKDIIMFGGGQDSSATFFYDDVFLYNVSSRDWLAPESFLSGQIRSGLEAVSVQDTYIVFGGGSAAGWWSDVDVFDVNSMSWVNLTEPLWPSGQGRSDYGIAAPKDLAIFAGGYLGAFDVTAVVDIFNVSCMCWMPSTNFTSGVARHDLASASVGSIALFGGGELQGLSSWSDVVDIYDAEIGDWRGNTTFESGVARQKLSAVALSEFIVFAGGKSDLTTYYDTIDIFNVSSMSWVPFTKTLGNTRAEMGGVSIGHFAVFGGGVTCCHPVQPNVDILVDVQRLQIDFASLENDSDDLRSDLKISEEDNANLNASVNSLTTENANLNASVNSLTTENANLNASANSLAQTNGILNSNITSLESEIGVLKDLNTVLSTNLTSCDQSLGECETKLKSSSSIVRPVVSLILFVL